MKPLSIRTSFQLIVLIGAVLPVAIVGVWLSGATARSGRALLHAQLNDAATTLASSISARWQTRQGELELLAGNEVVRAALAERRDLNASDSAYLREAASAMERSIPRVTFLNATGRQLWSASALQRVTDARTAGPPEPRLMTISKPIAFSLGAPQGRMMAQVRLSSLLSSQELGHLGAGVSVSVSLPDETPPVPLTGTETATRALDQPPLTLTLTAPSGPYVRPFEGAARMGLGVLVVVVMLAVVASALLSNRLTRSLDRLADAADAVAAGDLQREVPPSGPREIVRLATAFNSMTASLRSTLAEISRQKSLVAVGEFAASLSHEVRNSLTAIRVDLQHAARHVPPDSPSAPLVARTLGTVLRLDSVVTGALRIARSGQATPSRVSVRTILERAMRSAESTFDAVGGSLEPLAADVADVEIQGDAGALEQLFLNILMNAGQALSQGGHARVDVEDAGRIVIVRIVDTGEGIDAARLERVGTPLWTSKAEGTGLGLPIARRIAEAHGGGVTVMSESGTGTVVSVTLARQHMPMEVRN